MVVYGRLWPFMVVYGRLWSFPQAVANSHLKMATSTASVDTNSDTDNGTIGNKVDKAIDTDSTDHEGVNGVSGGSTTSIFVSSIVALGQHIFGWGQDTDIGELAATQQCFENYTDSTLSVSGGAPPLTALPAAKVCFMTRTVEVTTVNILWFASPTGLTD
jgi:hypothetical protein